MAENDAEQDRKGQEDGATEDDPFAFSVIKVSPRDHTADTFATPAVQQLQPAASQGELRRRVSTMPRTARKPVLMADSGSPEGRPRATRRVSRLSSVASEAQRRPSAGGYFTGPSSAKRRASSWVEPPADVVGAFTKLREDIEALVRKTDPPKPVLRPGALPGSNDFLVVDTGIPRLEVRQAVIALRRGFSQLSRTVLKAFADGGQIGSLDAAQLLEHAPRPLLSPMAGPSVSPTLPARDEACSTDGPAPLSRELLGAGALHCVLESIARELRAERATVFMHCNERDPRSGKDVARLVSVAAGGTSGPVEPIRIQPGQGVAGQVFRTALGLNVADTEKCGSSIFTRQHDQRTGFYTRCLLCLPLSGCIEIGGSAMVPDAAVAGGGGGKDRLVGVVQVLNKLPADEQDAVSGEFTEEDEKRLLEYAQLISTLIHSMRLSVADVLPLSRRVQEELASCTRSRPDPQSVMQAPPPLQALTLSEARDRLNRARRAARHWAATRRQSTPAIAMDGGDEPPPGTMPGGLRAGRPPVLICRIAADCNSSAPLGKVAAGAQTLREVSIYLERVEECWKASRETSVRVQAQLQRATRRLEVLESERRQLRSVEGRSSAASPSLTGPEPDAASDDASETHQSDGRRRSTFLRRREELTKRLVDKERMARHMQRLVNMVPESGGWDESSMGQEQLREREREAHKGMLAKHADERDSMLRRHEEEREELLRLLGDTAEWAGHEAQPRWPVPPRAKSARTAAGSGVRVSSARPTRPTPVPVCRHPRSAPAACPMRALASLSSALPFSFQTRSPRPQY